MLETIFLITAVVGGTVMVCQFLMMFLGMGDDLSGDVGTDVEFGGDAGADALGGEHDTTWTHAADADVGHPDGSRIFEVLSFRSVVAAVTFFGVAGNTSLASGHGETKALLIAVAAGAAAMYAIYWIMLQIYKLRTAGNENIRNAVGEPASVYVAIPGQGQGMGKVQVNIQNRTVEYQAVSQQEATLQSGDQVIVVEILGPDKVLVAAAAEPIETNV